MIRYAVLVLCLGVCSSGLASDGAQEAADVPPERELSWTEYVQSLYEKARASGEEVPSSVYSWAKEDLQAAGDWEYRIVTLSDNLSDNVSGTEILGMEETLNALGRERWECFWVREGGKGPQFFLKRSRKSYIRSVPFADMLKLLPGGDGSDGGVSAGGE